MNATEKFLGQRLMLAVVENHAEIVQALVNAGAQVNARTRNTFPGPHRSGGIIHDRPQEVSALIRGSPDRARQPGD